MWSIVIVDISTNECFVSRDRFGQKPLYYQSSEGVLFFSSEIQALPYVENIKPNLASIRSFLGRVILTVKEIHF